MLASVLAFGALFGFVGAIMAVPLAAGLQIVAEELTADRRARIAEADAAASPAVRDDGSRGTPGRLVHRVER